jgi:hypothetical protein
MLSSFRLRISLAAAGALVAALLAPAPAAAVDFGVRAGGYLEDNDPFAGIELLMPVFTDEWFFNPNIEFVFADRRDRVSANFDFHYDFRRTGDYYVWAGAGLAVIRLDDDRFDDDETDLGANLLGGVGWRLEGMTPYAQLKVVVADDSEFVAGVGIRF